MRHVAMHARTPSEVAVPRGWIVLGAALASWLVVAAMWTGMAQIYSLIAAVV